MAKVYHLWPGGDRIVLWWKLHLEKMGSGPVSSQPQAAFMLVGGFSSHENNGPLWSCSTSLPSASVRLQLRCQERVSRAQVMGQGTELDSDEGGQDLLPRPWIKAAAHCPNKWLADGSLSHFHWLRIKQIMWQLVRKDTFQLLKWSLGLTSHKATNWRMKNRKETKSEGM